MVLYRSLCGKKRQISWSFSCKQTHPGCGTIMRCELVVSKNKGLATFQYCIKILSSFSLWKERFFREYFPIQKPSLCVFLQHSRKFFNIFPQAYLRVITRSRAERASSGEPLSAVICGTFNKRHFFTSGFFKIQCLGLKNCFFLTLTFMHVMNGLSQTIFSSRLSHLFQTFAVTASVLSGWSRSAQAHMLPGL